MIDYLIHSAFIFFLTFVYYIVLNKAYDRWHKTKWLPVLKLLTIPFIILDAIVNIFIMSVFFLEFPKQWLVTARLKSWRLKWEYKGWHTLSKMQRYRLRFAIWFCDKWLDRFDYKTGNHC